MCRLSSPHVLHRFTSERHRTTSVLIILNYIVWMMCACVWLCSGQGVGRQTGRAYSKFRTYNWQWACARSVEIIKMFVTSDVVKRSLLRMLVFGSIVACRVLSCSFESNSHWAWPLSLLWPLKGCSFNHVRALKADQYAIRCKSNWFQVSISDGFRKRVPSGGSCYLVCDTMWQMPVAEVINCQQTSDAMCEKWKMRNPFRANILEIFIQFIDFSLNENPHRFPKCCSSIAWIATFFGEWIAANILEPEFMRLVVLCFFL